MKYAVIRLKGHQYKVKEGEEILVDHLDSKKIEPEVLLISEGDKVEVGKPVINDEKVIIKIMEEEVKGEKIHILKYKAKSRYRKHTGFRPLYTKLLIEKISL
ncbi:50S ribosomal protein L21 [Candidatus Woesebacteria bacterium RIFCSPHIGHO2_02_FULL_38_9]|uniref:Large ribosomal subunit protein bL21 n=1 Tax=Candidatus Woesebacteria bacterium RIFCSPHIGHO2_01_FULL_39_28 TaxID=1802496 RepID=A0A1F7YDG0_9BACT|nr:MAG: 50S ribosomal protein L21 [Candidatus Woesebacteria bacterium RIFCSPHIGHO2_01_FULL_39_28]OGM35038.1 MAG: 50S ribosomal protein L21 [Candidatus Woesebacteria bacterium RIFCSPHIGHO2_02_FULL_38_9]OGM58033.1 MAG: 50S ribosomal protein L21 [Candidatus Woesebacteria bacterium RIFCSPLOWO2_01_FULL_38_20]